MPPIRIIHGGQTGVDRGAHLAALDNGWEIAGYMPKNGRDENGPVPADIARHLRRSTLSGYAIRTEINIEYAEALLVVVPDKNDPYVTPGTALTLKLARERSIPRRIADPVESAMELADWINMLRRRVGEGHPLRLLVAGPRASRWTDGQLETSGLLRRMWMWMIESAA